MGAILDRPQDWLYSANRAMCVLLERWNFRPEEEHAWTLRLSRGPRTAWKIRYESGDPDYGTRGARRRYRRLVEARY